MWLIFYFFIVIFVNMKNMIFLDYDSDRVGNEIRIGKPNQEAPTDRELESELLNQDLELISGGLIKLINEAHKLGYWDKSTILTEVVDKLLKEKYDKSREGADV
jgi:hypothetical protein